MRLNLYQENVCERVGASVPSGVEAVDAGFSFQVSVQALTTTDGGFSRAAAGWAALPSGRTATRLGLEAWPEG